MSKSPSLRRIQADIRELALDPSDRYHAAPLEHDMFEWHFTIRGADETDFAGGIYHGRILLPPEYPFKPPHIIFLTKSGRFETNTKVCLSFSAFHPELWQPAWGIRLILEALISFLPTPADGALGALDWSAAERRKLAQQSVQFYCPVCKCHVKDLLPELKKKETSNSSGDGDGDGAREGAPSATISRFQKEILELQRLQMQEHAAMEEKLDEEKKLSSEDQKKESTISSSSHRAEEEIAADSEGAAESKDGAAELMNASTTADSAAATVTVENDNTATDSSASVAATATGLAQQEELSNNSSRAGPVSATASTPPAPAAQPATEEEVVHRNDDATEQNIAPPVPVDAALEQPQSAEGAVNSMLDPLLHAIIILLSIIVYVLLRKIQALMADLRALED